MRLSTAAILLSSLPLSASLSSPLPAPTPIPPTLHSTLSNLSLLVDITYCIPSLPPAIPPLPPAGLTPPFTCLSHCTAFPTLQLLRTFHSGGVLLADTCGYIARDPESRRLLVAFRGTYSLADAVIDLATLPQKYVPYDRVEPPGNHNGSTPPPPQRCPNCTVHAGFLAVWRAGLRDVIWPVLQEQRRLFPEYEMHFVGHSLGGAMAALAGVEAVAEGWGGNGTQGGDQGGGGSPSGRVVVTTFGQPRVGNEAWGRYVEGLFGLDDDGDEGDGAGKEESHSSPPSPAHHDSSGPHRYRRITHLHDPVPLLPPSEFGFAPHAGEIFIARAKLPPRVGDRPDDRGGNATAVGQGSDDEDGRDWPDVYFCRGARDPRCSIAGEGGGQAPPSDNEDDDNGTGSTSSSPASSAITRQISPSLPRQVVLSPQVLREMDDVRTEAWGWGDGRPGIPTRYRLWELVFAHRDYFYRLGLCVPGGDPTGGGVGGGEGDGNHDVGRGSGKLDKDRDRRWKFDL